MDINISYEQEFNDIWMYLKSKYPAKLFDLDGVGKQLDLAQFSRQFFSQSTTTTADASVDANANVDDISVISYSNELKKPYERLNSYYMLWKELKRLYGLQFANEVMEMQLTGDIYIHDFHGVGGGLPYCYNYSTYDIATKGLCTVKKITSVPPKHFMAFKSQLEQFIVIASNSTLGATGLADMLVVTSFYVEKMLETISDAHFKFASKEDVWIYVKETLTSFVYTINQPMRANQSPFTNVSVYDTEFLKEMCEDYINPLNGKSANLEIVCKLQDMFLDIMNEELSRTPATFPITTSCHAVEIKDNKRQIIDEEFLYNVAEKSLAYGFINFYLGKSSTLSSCCRLRSNKDNEYFNSFGSGSSKIGSVGVCSINSRRLALKYGHDKKLFEDKLRYMVGVCAKINNAKRHIIKRRIERGNQPLYSEGFVDLSTQFSTVGVNGFNETIKTLGYDILTDEGSDIGVWIINIINSENEKYQKQYKVPHNCEQVPGESTGIKLADKDTLLKYQNDCVMYSNQFIPLITKADLLDRIKLQGKFDMHFSGGAILHINVEERITDPQVIVDLIKTCAELGIVYFAINYNLQRCENGHMTVGKNTNCPICNSLIIDNFTRVVGFLTNVKNWSPTRREIDYPDRQFYEKHILFER